MVVAVIANASPAQGDEMQIRNGSIRPLAWLAVPAFTILAFVACATTGAKTSYVPLPVVVSSPPPGCEDIGEVKGVDGTSGNASEDVAKRRALEQAQELGATHVTTSSSGMVPKYVFGGFDWVYVAKAYRCPFPAPSTQGK
jgi:hypothetical protein